jgi:phosphopantothenoylcysteine decarboxylase
VRLIATKSSQTFFTKESIIGDGKEDVRLFTDDDEWSSWHKRGDDVLHIEVCM